LPYGFDKILSILSSIESLYKKLNISVVPCHNDPNPSNFLLTNQGLMLIDWEYSGNNDPAWDLAYLSIASKLNSHQDSLLLKFYDTNNQDTTLYNRFIVNKVLTQLWRFYWLRFQPLVENDMATKKEFINFSNEMYKNYENIIKSSEFINSCNILLKKTSNDLKKE